jgi:hypothetical protein
MGSISFEVNLKRLSSYIQVDKKNERYKRRKNFSCADILRYDQSRKARMTWVTVRAGSV